MRYPLTTLFCLIAGTSITVAQVGGATSSPGGGAAPGAAAPGASAPGPTGTPGAATSNSTWPGQPAPGVSNTPVDPGRNNIDVSPPTRAIPGESPRASGPAMSAPGARPGEPGTSTPGAGKTAGRPGAAQSSNSDGHAECMAMWSPSNTGVSRDEWSKTCDWGRLPPKK
jgi:hypothetical protein